MKRLLDRSILAEAFFGIVLVLHVFHVRYDGLGVEAVLLVGAKLFFVELLALYATRVDLAELGEVCIAMLVSLSGVVRHLGAL